MQHLTTPFWRKSLSFFLAFLILVYSTGCHSYFKVRYFPPDQFSDFRYYANLDDYFVLHTASGLYQLDGITFDTAFLYARIDTASAPVHYTPDRKYPKYRIYPYEKTIVKEVHFYLKDDVALPLAEKKISIPLASLEKIEVIDPDSGKTVLAVLGNLVLGYFIIGMILVIIFILTKSSCPYVYAYTGESYFMQGEIYSGAIFKGMERPDFLPLPDLQPVDNIYRIRIANELKEEQHTNLANLVVVNHPGGTQCWIDQEGKPYIVSNPKAPFEAFSESGRDYSAEMTAADHHACLFDEVDADTNRLYLGFENPGFTEEGTLLLNVKNSIWGEYVCGEFLKKFGYLYPTWIKLQNRKPPEKVKGGLDEMGFPLRVYLETDNGWELIHKTELTGSLIDRDLAIPVDLSRAKSETLHLRLESNFLFWEVDYAAMDYSLSSDMEVMELKPFQAFGTTGTDAIHALSEDDGLYLDHWNTGDWTEVHFEAPHVPEGFTQSCFLHSKGYYNHVREYTHAPALDELKKFKDPAYFNTFSKALFKSKMKEFEEEYVLN
ncbi:MAG: hypothetical protein H6563_09415 [Lewinellaceae bacterium]|nr:hypothetical protein [Lewinellaceae bacterium]